jgi:hypothetical protein
MMQLKAYGFESFVLKVALAPKMDIKLVYRQVRKYHPNLPSQQTYGIYLSSYHYFFEHDHSYKPS